MGEEERRELNDFMALVLVRCGSIYYCSAGTTTDSQIVKVCAALPCLRHPLGLGDFLAKLHFIFSSLCLQSLFSLAGCSAAQFSCPHFLDATMLRHEKAQ